MSASGNSKWIRFEQLLFAINGPLFNEDTLSDGFSPSFEHLDDLSGPFFFKNFNFNFGRTPCLLDFGYSVNLSADKEVRENCVCLTKELARIRSWLFLAGYDVFPWFNALFLVQVDSFIWDSSALA